MHCKACWATSLVTSGWRSLALFVLFCLHLCCVVFCLHCVVLCAQVTTRVLFSGPGDVCETDVTLATNANALVLAFNVKVPAAQAKELRGGVLCSRCRPLQDSCPACRSACRSAPLPYHSLESLPCAYRSVCSKRTDRHHPQQHLRRCRRAWGAPVTVHALCNRGGGHWHCRDQGAVSHPSGRKPRCVMQVVAIPPWLAIPMARHSLGSLFPWLLCLLGCTFPPSFPTSPPCLTGNVVSSCVLLGCRQGHRWCSGHCWRVREGYRVRWKGSAALSCLCWFILLCVPRRELATACVCRLYRGPPLSCPTPPPSDASFAFVGPAGTV